MGYKLGSLKYLYIDMVVIFDCTECVVGNILKSI